MKMKTIALAVFVLALGGCATQGEQIIKEQAKLERQRMELEQERLELEQSKRKAEIKSAPEWALQPPDKDSTGIYAVGIADSDKLFLAMKKAKLQAEFSIAQQYNQFLSGSERSYEKDGSSGQSTSKTEFLIDKLVAEVPVSGYSIVRQEVVALNGRHTAYILLKMPYDEFNKILIQRKELDTDAAMDKAFEGLEKRLEARRKKLPDPVAVETKTTVNMTAKLPPPLPAANTITAKSSVRVTAAELPSIGDPLPSQ